MYTNICFIMHIRTHMHNNQQNNVSEVIDQWEWFSGYMRYPVSHPNLDSPKTAYDNVRDLWAGEYGDRRRDFCRFVAGKLREKYLTVH